MKNHIISPECSAKEALSQLENIRDGERKTLFVIDLEGKLLGSLTDGDIRRGLIRNLNTTDPVSLFMNRDFRYLDETEPKAYQKIRVLAEQELTFIPVLSHGKLIKTINAKELKNVVPATAIIMAGGRGQRLRPLTDTLPKPMLTVGDKPIIEHNIDRLISFGIEDIYISVNYLKEKIQNYFGDGSSKGISIKYLTEDQPLGTIGALSQIKGFRYKDFLIMNSDLLTNLDIAGFFSDFKEQDVHMSVASLPYEVKIPYAVLDTEGKRIKSFKEKPSYTYYSNGGIYFAKSDVLNTIPVNEFYNATDLMNDLLKDNKGVAHYPLLDYWLDIGRHQDFEKAQDDIKHLKL